MSPSATNCTAVVSTQVIKKLELAEDFSISPEQIVKYCDDALQVAKANEELHTATRIFDTMTSAVKRTLKICLKKRKNMAFKLPDNLKDLDLADDDNWKKVRIGNWIGCRNCAYRSLKTPSKPYSKPPPRSRLEQSLARCSHRSKSSRTLAA